MAEGEERRFTRTNRGARMALLIGEAQDAAAGEVTKGALQGTSITYNDYFNESSDEGSYIQSDEEEDTVDSDFVTDDEEEEDDDDAEMDIKEQEKAEKRKAKGKGAYVDAAKRQRATRAAAPSDDSDSDNGGKAASGRDRNRRRAPTDSTPGDRRSYRQSTAQRSEASKSAAKEELRRRREMPKASRQEERRLTQEELLEEAKETALENAKDLERLVRIEEDLMRVDWSRAPLVGPRIIYQSTKASNLITFSDPDSSIWADWAEGAMPQPAKKAVCVITGQPAKYRDPKTGHPYATIEAFRKIREKEEKGK